MESMWDMQGSAVKKIIVYEFDNIASGTGSHGVHQAGKSLGIPPLPVSISILFLSNWPVSNTENLSCLGILIQRLKRIVQPRQAYTCYKQKAKCLF